LKTAALARDLPGMADVDSSLLLFCKTVKEKHTVTLSGECADELFGGYPWFFTTNDDEKLFPWAKSLELRKSLLNKKYLVSNPEKFVQDEIEKTLADVQTLTSDTKKDVQMRKLFILNVRWFMQTLLDRKDRMSMYNGLEVRVPFCDKRLAQYAYNIPWALKALDGREKGLMRAAFTGILPHEIVYRKKNPYPKTFEPEFLRAVRDEAISVVNGGGVVSQLIDKEYFNTLLETGNPDEKFYGQLMRLPQIYAWICQMDTIFNEYGVVLAD
jgi:asparagine synthase (glutamine-hydrolysing)